METILYFLRSSEQYIVTDILSHALSLDDVHLHPQFDPLHKRYGHTNKDLGVYALHGHDLAGAAWIRLLPEAYNLPGYVDALTPVLIIGVKPQYRGKGIGTALLSQLLSEAAVLYGSLSLCVERESPAVSFFERFGFAPVGSDNASSCQTMSVSLHQEQSSVSVPSYGPCRWIE